MRQDRAQRLGGMAHVWPPVADPHILPKGQSATGAGGEVRADERPSSGAMELMRVLLSLARARAASGGAPARQLRPPRSGSMAAPARTARSPRRSTASRASP